jgi:hypothetical protein
MLVTLPDGELAPETSVIDVEILPAPSRAAITEQDSEQTSALPSAPHAAAEDAAVEPGGELEPVAAVAPEAAPEGAGNDPSPPQEEPEEAAAAPETTKADAAKSAKPALAAKKPVAARSRSAKPAVRRSAKTQARSRRSTARSPGCSAPGRRRSGLGASPEDQAALDRADEMGVTLPSAGLVSESGALG